jgi:O-antigen/teichoic acid export membrane protein
MLGLPNSINYFLAQAEDRKERNRFLSLFYTFCTLLCILTGIISVLSIPLSEAYFENPHIKTYAFYLLVYPWTNSIIGSLSNVLVVYGQEKKLLTVQFVHSLASLFSVILVKVFNWSFLEYLIVFLALNVLITFWVYWIVNRLDGKLRVRCEISFVKKVLAFSIPIGLAALVGTLNIEIDKLMIGKLFNTEMLAIYTNAGKELPVTIVSASFTAVLLPQLTRYLKNEEIKPAVEAWGYSIQLSYIVICFFTTACIVFAPQMISIMYSDKYLPGVSVFRIYALVLLLRVTYFGMALNAIGKTKFILYCSIASLGLNVLLNYVMYLLLGFIGPAVATFISMALVGILQLHMTGKLIHVRIKEIFPWKSLLSITLLNVIWGLLAYIAIQIIHLTTSVRDITICIFAGCLIAVIYYFAIRKAALKCWRGLNTIENH